MTGGDRIRISLLLAALLALIVAARVFDRGGCGEMPHPDFEPRDHARWEECVNPEPDWQPPMQPSP